MFHLQTCWAMTEFVMCQNNISHIWILCSQLGSITKEKKREGSQEARRSFSHRHNDSQKKNSAIVLMGILYKSTRCAGKVRDAFTFSGDSAVRTEPQMLFHSVFAGVILYAVMRRGSGVKVVDANRLLSGKLAPSWRWCQRGGGPREGFSELGTRRLVKLARHAGVVPLGCRLHTPQEVSPTNSY